MLKKLSITVLGIVLTATTIQAQKTKLPDGYHLRKLSNGLEVLIIEDHSVPIATIELVVRNGAYVQDSSLEGLAHLYEHMFFKANDVYPSQEKYMERVKELGVVFNGTTSEERVNYFITLGKSNLEEGIKFMKAATVSPKFDKEEMKKENVVVAGEFQRAESNPVFFLLRDVGKKMWGDLYSHKNTIGEYDVILSATPEIMTDIKNRFYHPNNSILAIAGDVDPEATFNMVENIYGDWKKSNFDIFTKYPIPDFKPMKMIEHVLVEEPNAQIPILLYGYHGPDTRNDVEATYAADVFSFILAQQGSNFQQELVESGLALQAALNYQTAKYTGPINLFLVPNPQKIEEAMKALEEQIAKFDDPDYITDEQLETAKRMLEIDTKYGEESTSSHIHTVTFWWASASLDYYMNYIDNLKKVTKQDIADYARKYIIGKNRVVGMLINPQMKSMIPESALVQNTIDVSAVKLKFDDDKNAELSKEMMQQLDKVVYTAKVNDRRTLVVDLMAPKQKVADARAEAVKSYLVDKGVNQQRLNIKTSAMKTKKLDASMKDQQNTVTFNIS